MSSSTTPYRSQRRGSDFGSADWVVLYKDEPPIILTVVGEREAQNAVDRLNEAFNRGYWEGRKRGPAN